MALEIKVSIILSIIAILISGASVGFSIYIYKKHDKKLKEQGNQIKTFKLKEYQEKEDDIKRAKIEIKCHRIKNKYQWIYSIQVENIGLAEARNLTISFPENITDILSEKIENQPLKISSNSEYSFKIKSKEEFPKSADITINWDDDFRKDNQMERHIYFK